jgi:hypothetical protein
VCRRGRRRLGDWHSAAKGKKIRGPGESGSGYREQRQPAAGLDYSKVREDRAIGCVRGYASRGGRAPREPGAREEFQGVSV